MGPDELGRLRTVLLAALASVRPSVAAELSAKGLDTSEPGRALLLQRAQLVLYYMRVHEVTEDVLKELRLVELVHLMLHEPGLEALRTACCSLLRHGSWGRRASAVGMHPDAAAPGLADAAAPPGGGLVLPPSAFQ